MLLIPGHQDCAIAMGYALDPMWSSWWSCPRCFDPRVHPALEEPHVRGFQRHAPHTIMASLSLAPKYRTNNLISLFTGCSLQQGTITPGTTGKPVYRTSDKCSILMGYSFSYGQYIWPALLVMGFDHFLRALRLVVYNFGYIIGKRPTGLDAQVEVLSSDFMRISLHRPQHVNWAPGQSAFISMPGIAPFQFHPFTISTVDVSGMPPTKFATDSQAHLAYSATTDAQKLTFLVRVRKGFTHNLHRNAQDDKSLKVFFDGPYGSPPVLKGFGTVLLIAGMLFPEVFGGSPLSDEPLKVDLESLSRFPFYWISFSEHLLNPSVCQLPNCVIRQSCGKR